MNKEMSGMSNEEMFAAIMMRLDTVEISLKDLSGVNGKMDCLNDRMDGLDSRMDNLDSRMDGLDSRMDSLDSRMDNLEESLNSRMDKLDDRMDQLDARVDKLDAKIDCVELGLNQKIDNLEANVFMEIQAVRTEMEVVNKSLKQDIGVLDQKIDRLLFTKDVDGYEKLKIRVEVLEDGYRNLKEKIC